jgi:hypothetical protein
VPTVFPFLHNWLELFGGDANPVVERLEWLTDIIPSHTDYEQRIDVRPYGPRRIFEYEIPLADARTRRLFHNITHAPNQVYYVPVCSDMTLTTGTATNAGVDLDAEFRDFDTGAYAMLWSNPWTYDFVTIEGTTATSISYTTTLANSWPAGSLIVPMRRAHLAHKVPGRSHATNLETVSCEFRVLAEELSTNRRSTYTPVLHRSLGVFFWGSATTSWQSERPYVIEYRGSDLDFETGVFTERAQDSGATKTLRARMLFNARSDMAEFIDWLHETRGRQKLRWVSSGQDDFAYVSGAGTTAVTVEQSGYASVWAAANNRRDVRVTNAAGSTVSKTITSVGTSGSDEVLNFSTNAPANIARISFLHLCRLASDTVEFQWHHKGAILEAGLEFKEVLNSDWID